MKNWKRTLLIGFVWGIFFFLWWLTGFLYENWNFRLFSYKSWKYLFSEFSSGWVISSVSDWIFLFTILFAIPLFIYGWHLLLMVKWRKTFQKVFSFLTKKWRRVQSDKKVIKIAAQKSHKKKRPRPLNRLGKTVENTLSSLEKKDFSEEQMAKETSGMPAFPSNESNMSVFSDLSFPEETSSFSDENEFTPILETKSKSDTTPVSILNEDVPDLLIKAGYKVVKDAIVSKLPVSFVALSAGQILLCLIDSEKGEWLADEERFNGEDPLWFSENSHRVSPIYKLLEATNRFSDRLVKAGLAFKVVPVFVEAAGIIINAEDMKSVWDESGVITCRTASGGPEILNGFGKSIPSAEEAIPTETLERIRDLF